MSQLKIKNGGSWEAIPAGGIGVPSGGTTGQVLQKSSNTDYATEWATPLTIRKTTITATVASSGNIPASDTGLSISDGVIISAIETGQLTAGYAVVPFRYGNNYGFRVFFDTSVSGKTLTIDVYLADV